MEAKKMGMLIVGLVLTANFALAASASLEKDVITADAVRALKRSNKLSSDAINELVKRKTIVSKTEFEQLLQQDANAVAGIGIPCGESCVWIPCITSIFFGCKCSEKVCYL